MSGSESGNAKPMPKWAEVIYLQNKAIMDELGIKESE